MPTKLNKQMYTKLIEQDIEELNKCMPKGSLERQHIEDVLKDSIKRHYTGDEATDYEESGETYIDIKIGSIYTVNGRYCMAAAEYRPHNPQDPATVLHFVAMDGAIRLSIRDRDRPFGLQIRAPYDDGTQTYEIKYIADSVETFLAEPYKPYMDWCDVSDCENEGCSGGMAWPDTGYWMICREHMNDFRKKKPQPKMRQEAIKREKSRDMDGFLP